METGGGFEPGGVGPDAPGPGAGYGWFLLAGAFLVLIACLGTVATGNLFALGLAVIGVAVVGVGVHERRKGTRAW